ncbi:MAG TPA: hypothetical protein VI688_07700 [Anaerolineales bacterium]|nr:hypothetical protein [Anaerolineales bacterium]
MALLSPNAPDLDWEQFSIRPADLEFLSAYLLEVETPLGPEELATQLIRNRLRLAREQQASLPQSRTYAPKESYSEGDRLVFAAQDWAAGRVLRLRPSKSINGASFGVIEVLFDDGQTREYAAALAEHELNQVPVEAEESPDQQADLAARVHAPAIAPQLAEALRQSPEFVYIAGRWFPKALIIDVGQGQLNVAEAFLDMAVGGPLPTRQLLGEVELPEGVNPKLAEFSLDLALQEDERFDEVGPAGEVAWFLRRLEPEAVRDVPLFLRYVPIDHDRSSLSEEMLDVERRLEDELTPPEFQPGGASKEIQIPLIFPHWHMGSLPLTRRVAQLFPTAYESPRVRFDFVDGQSGERFQGWVVRPHGCIFGLHDWYLKRGLMPGSYVHARRGTAPGEVHVSAEAHRSSKEWVRTALVGADGGVVYANLKQQVESSFDERMVIFLPGELQALETNWQRRAGKPVSNFAQLVTQTMSELAKMNTQNHVHAVELYSAINLILRCPPAPLFSLLAARPQFQHVGHLHFRVDEQIAAP